MYFQRIAVNALGNNVRIVLIDAMERNVVLRQWRGFWRPSPQEGRLGRRGIGTVCWVRGYVEIAQAARNDSRNRIGLVGYGFKAPTPPLIVEPAANTSPRPCGDGPPLVIDKARRQRSVRNGLQLDLRAWLVSTRRVALYLPKVARSGCRDVHVVVRQNILSVRFRHMVRRRLSIEFQTGRRVNPIFARQLRFHLIAAFGISDHSPIAAVVVRRIQIYGNIRQRFTSFIDDAAMNHDSGFQPDIADRPAGLADRLFDSQCFGRL